MGKQHETIPNEPEETPLQPDRTEVEQPNDPKVPEVPQEAPQNDRRRFPGNLPNRRSGLTRPGRILIKQKFKLLAHYF